MRLKSALILLILVFSAHLAKAEYFNTNQYDVDIKILGSKGVIEVTETITVTFSEARHGIYRSIAYKNKIDGKIIELDFFDVQVNGFKFKTYHEGNDFIIRIGDANEYVDGTQTYTLSYKVKNAWLFMEDHTEFYWNLIGTSWPTSIDQVKYSIVLDESMPMTDKDYYIYTGREGEKGQNANIEYYVNTFSGATKDTLQANEGLTVAINLPLNYVKRPSEWEVLWAKYGLGGIGSILFLLISGLFYRTWTKYGKDYHIVKVVQYTPPKGINPAEAGVIIDEKADNVDILALLPYWAHLGYINIKRIPSNWGKADHELIKLKDLPNDAHPYEKIVFEGLFAHQKTVLVSSLENSFYQYLQSAKGSLKTHLNNMGIYYPISMKMQAITGVISFVVVALGFLSVFFFQSFMLGIPLIMAGLLGFFFSYHMLKKNEKGVQLFQEILGFKMFVKAAEKDKLERLLKEDPDYFEKTLPYAMIFGYAKSWSKKFDGLLVEPPKWYVTPYGYYGNGFMPSDFGSTFDNSIKEIQSVFSSTPQSSGGGGSFSGGGSSGGGFGGGGGGSW